MIRVEDATPEQLAEMRRASAELAGWEMARIGWTAAQNPHDDLELYVCWAEGWHRYQQERADAVEQTDS